MALCTAAALLGALVESMLVPLYAGSVPIPLAPVLAVVLNVVLVTTGRRAVGRALGGVLPFLGWLVPVLAFSGYQPPEQDVIYPGGSGPLPWIGYGVVLGGGLAGAVALMLSAPLPQARTRAGQQPSTGATPGPATGSRR
ncbi:hypothetical protein [Jatrophihabitans sp.]|uniref:hypothetical protein n=1 Tax=Jatrophihabitans sp. TaxID=1932789 RepID=UPI003F80596E